MKKKLIDLMIKYLFYILISLFYFNLSFSKDINIQENINLSYKCKLDKKIIKNSEYNYQTFTDKDLEKKVLEKFEIESIQPDKLLITGLSSFLSSSEKLNVKIVNKDVVLFKAIDQDNSYSESAIIDRQTGELLHEITKNIESENSEKYISFYSCKKMQENV